MKSFQQLIFALTMIVVLSKPLLKKRNYLPEDIELMLLDEQINEEAFKNLLQEKSNNEVKVENYPKMDIEKDMNSVVEFCEKFVEGDNKHVSFVYLVIGSFFPKRPHYE